MYATDAPVSFPLTNKRQVLGKRRVSLRESLKSLLSKRRLEVSIVRLRRILDYFQEVYKDDCKDEEVQPRVDCGLHMFILNLILGNEEVQPGVAYGHHMLFSIWFYFLGFGLCPIRGAARCWLRSSHVYFKYDFNCFFLSVFS